MAFLCGLCNDSASYVAEHWHQAKPSSRIHWQQVKLSSQMQDQHLNCFGDSRIRTKDTSCPQREWFEILCWMPWTPCAKESSLHQQSYKSASSESSDDSDNFVADFVSTEPSALCGSTCISGSRNLPRTLGSCGASWKCISLPLLESSTEVPHIGMMQIPWDHAPLRPTKTASIIIPNGSRFTSIRGIEILEWRV